MRTRVSPSSSAGVQGRRSRTSTLGAPGIVEERMDDVAQPRSGILGGWDRLVGPGATAWENAVTLVVAPVAAAVAVAWLPPDSTMLQRVVAAVLAFDVIAGVWVMSTPAARRWYGRPNRPTAMRWAFALGHAHPFVVAAVFDGSMAWAATLYGGMVATTIGLRWIASQARVPTLALAVVVLLGLGRLVGEDPLLWFAPAYLVKLLIGHLGQMPEVSGRARAR